MCRWILIAFGVLLITSDASEWPQFLGPTRNGVYAGNDLARVWPKEGPPKRWEKKIGEGFSGITVANGRAILFHRLGNKEVIEALKVESGEPIWTFDYSCAYRDDFARGDGPRATPAIANEKIITFGAEGMLSCLDSSSGKKIWSVDAKEQFGATKGFFGMACSPLVEGNNVLLNMGGKNGAGIVAFDQQTGRTVWKATDHEAGYSSPVGATVHGRRVAAFLTRSGLVILDPEKGKVHSEFPWRARMAASVNAATPLVIGDLIFLSASYDTGAIVLALKENNKLQEIWSSDEALSNHYATSVHRAGFLYGFHGRQEEGPSLRCIELKTGRVRWSREQGPAGTVTLADDMLLVLFEDGRLMLAEAASERFRMIAEAQILPFGARAYPAVANGYLYARSKDKLVCVNLGKAN